MKNYAYFNGEIILEDDIVISHHDLGFLRGYGIMDAMRTVKGRPFLLKEHFERLDYGMKAMNLETGLNLEKFGKIIDNLLQQNKTNEDVAIKTLITGGRSSNGLKMDGLPTGLITINNLEAVSPSADLYRNGAKVVSLEFQRPMPEIKTTNYIFAIQQQKLKDTAEANEIIYFDKGLLLEGATSSIFVVKNNKIITPSVNILSGTMRNFVIKILAKENITVEVRRVKLEEALNADEIFLTGTFKNILPIVRVDDIMVGDGKVGKVTKTVMKMINEIMQ